MTFKEVARKVLSESAKPISAGEIWDEAVRLGLDKQLDSHGKTPWRTLHARLWEQTQIQDSDIGKTNDRPSLFFIKKPARQAAAPAMKVKRHPENRRRKDEKAGKTGWVYILTNPSFREDWVKIGRSSRPVDVRLKELDNTAVPLPFEIYATLETAKYEIVEKKIHKAIDRLTDLRIRQNREFFNISPEQAFDILGDEAAVLDDAELLRYRDNKPIRDKSQTVDNGKSLDAADGNTRSDTHRRSGRA